MLSSGLDCRQHPAPRPLRLPPARRDPRCSNPPQQMGALPRQDPGPTTMRKTRPKILAEEEGARHFRMLKMLSSPAGPPSRPPPSKWWRRHARVRRRFLQFVRSRELVKQEGLILRPWAAGHPAGEFHTSPDPTTSASTTGPPPPPSRSTALHSRSSNRPKRPNTNCPTDRELPARSAPYPRDAFSAPHVVRRPLVSLRLPVAGRLPVAAFQPAYDPPVSRQVGACWFLVQIPDCWFEVLSRTPCPGDHLVARLVVCWFEIPIPNPCPADFIAGEPPVACR